VPIPPFKPISRLAKFGILQVKVFFYQKKVFLTTEA
jgi:hypothetical protein